MKWWLLLACACTHAAPVVVEPVKPVEPVTTATVTEPAWLTAPPFDPDTHFVAVAVAPTPEAALAAARHGLLESLWGAGRSDVPQTADAAVENQRLQDGRFAALLAVTKSEAARALTDWLPPIPPAPATDTEPEDLWALLAHVKALRQHSYGCERMRAWRLACTPPETSVFEARLRRFAGRIELVQRPEDGAPYWPNEAPPAPVRVEARLKGSKGALLPNCPLLALGAETPRARTASDGQAQFVFRSAQTATITVDAEQLGFGPWPTPALPIGWRDLSGKKAKLALVIRERANGLARPGIEALSKALGQLGLRVVPLPEPSLGALMRADTPEAKAAAFAALTPLADLVLVGELHTELVGRMGGRSVWYEAAGTLVLHDLWRGAQRGVVSDAKRALGLGEPAATEQAFLALGEALAGTIAELLETEAPKKAAPGR